MAKGRVACVDLAAEDGAKLFSQNIMAASSVEGLFPYGSKRFKKRPCWSELLVHRTVVADAFELSKGMLINQRSLQSQLEKFLDTIGKPYTSVATEAAIYRFRCMMSQLRYVKKSGVHPPKGFESLGNVIDLIKVGSDIEDGSDGEEVSDLDADLAIVCRSPKPVDVVEVSDVEFDFQAGDDIGSMLTELFDTPSKPERPVVESTPEKPRPVVEPTPEKPQTMKRMTLDEIDRAISEVGLASANGPTSADYRAVFKRPSSKVVAKRPAGKSKSKKGKKCSERNALVKRVYSKAYHDEVSRLSGSGLKMETIRSKARQCGRDATWALEV